MRTNQTRIDRLEKQLQPAGTLIPIVVSELLDDSNRFRDSAGTIYTEAQLNEFGPDVLLVKIRYEQEMP